MNNAQPTLHGDVIFVYVRILSYGGRNTEYYCSDLAMIERNIVSVFANASDYSNKICICRYNICLYFTNYASIVEVSTVIGVGTNVAGGAIAPRPTFL